MVVPQGTNLRINKLLDCAVAFARDVGVNSASTEFYSVIEQATRHLDRNMSTIYRQWQL
jgi:hypothetical protein